MPSASSKSSQPQAFNMAEVLQDPLKGAVSVLEKKMRNLEKRKLKLLEYQKKMVQGTDLNEEQKKAASDLILVENSLKTVEDMRKNMASMEQEYNKQSKRESKRVKMEQERATEATVQSKVMSVIEIQAVLSSLSEDVRPDFLAGMNGACELSEADFEKLDKLFEMTHSIEKRSGKISEQISVNTNHLLGVVDSSEGDLAEGIAYVELNNILKKISESGYFEKDIVEPAQEVEEPEPAEEAAEDNIEETEAVPVEDAVEAISEPIAATEINEVEEEPEVAEEKVEELEQINFEVTQESYGQVEQPLTNGVAPTGMIVGGVDLPPEVEEKGEGEESIDFMGDSEVDVYGEEPAEVEFDSEPAAADIIIPQTFTPTPAIADPAPVQENSLLNPAIQEFVPRIVPAEEPAVPVTNGWTPAPAAVEATQWATNEQPAEQGWTNVERSNPVQEGYRGRGRGRGGFRGRGEYRGGERGGYRGGSRGGYQGERREPREGGGYYRGGRGGGNGEDGGYRGGRGGYRGGDRGDRGGRGRDGEGRGGYRGGYRGNNDGNRGGYRGNAQRGNYQNRPQQPQQPEQ